MTGEETGIGFAEAGALASPAQIIEEPAHFGFRKDKELKKMDVAGSEDV